tara:strand:+ start:366 stop:836 length:471 start_codon:yes stop_codon:yes gene_type:complete
MNDKYLKESIDILNRSFGDPLPTLEDTMKKHKLNKEGGKGSGRPAKPGGAKDIDNKMSKAAQDANDKMDRDEKKKRENESISVTESPDDIRITKKELQMLIKIEGKFRERMLKVEQGFLRDPRTENKKLAKDIKKSYKDNVTKFMREVVGMIKRMK